MSDLLFEYKVRARHRLGWKEFSFYATTEIEEFLNRNSIDYVRNATDTVEHRQLKEIERLNNIINELEKWLNEKICLNKNDKDYINGMTFVGVNLQMYQMFLDKLQELKGNNNGVWVNNLLEVIKENNIEFGSEKE